ncbi:MAG: 30S ribosomal protein S18 [Chloroflexi bacterium]|nr:30S ribosomal protein S18 [Chloroflexota bacterium]
MAERDRTNNRDDSDDEVTPTEENEETSEQSSAPRGGGPRRPYQRGRPRARIKACRFCTDKNKVIDYKDVDLMLSLTSPRGRILPRRKTGTCAKHQRMVTQAIKRARHMAILPYSAEHVRSTNE